jgi:hypothetical protein
MRKNERGENNPVYMQQDGKQENAKRRGCQIKVRGEGEKRERESGTHLARLPNDLSLSHSKTRVLTWQITIKTSARSSARLSAMFTTRRLFGDLPCPLRDSCNRPICLFSHNPTPIPTTSFIFNVPEPAPAAAKAVPAKRPAQSDAPLTPQQVPSSSRPSYPANEERPTKLRKTGSAAKPVAVPTASSSPVSKKKTHALLHFPHWYSRLEFLSLRSMLGSQRYPFRRARYVTRLVSVQSQCGIRTSCTWPSTSSLSHSPLHAHILVPPSIFSH